MENFGEILCPILVKAGEIMLSAHHIESDGSVKEKSGDAANLVTVYDVAVQDFLLSEIKKKITNATFIAEEKENDPAVLQNEYCFIIDPIDGTANFAHEYRHSCISLAMFSHGEAVFCAVYDPYQNEMFSATKGQGAFLNGKRIHVADRDTAHSIVAFGTSPYYKATLGDVTFKICHELFLAFSDLRRCGSAALDLAYLAAGRNDVFFECVLSPWDIAGGALLITEAGGVITDMDGNAISYEKPSPVVAATPRVYDTVLQIVKKVRG